MRSVNRKACKARRDAQNTSNRDSAQLFRGSTLTFVPSKGTVALCLHGPDNLPNPQPKLPFDQYFQSPARTKRAKASAKDESVEMQLGRSDFTLGERRCPFPLDGNDALEWTRGYQAEKDKYPKPPIKFGRRSQPSRKEYKISA